VVPILIVLALFVFTVLAENKVDATPANPGATVSVNAFQWGWEFDYPGGVKVIGQTTQAPTMVIPAGTDVAITLKSLDVLHGFYVPSSTSAATPARATPPGSTSTCCTPGLSEASAPSSAGCTTRSCSSMSGR
jgi:heme/copper-type cytochrome/quinol oxidase subunit 2